MESNQWQRIEELFHAASQLAAAERDVYLKRECAGDDVLLGEVESLIAASADSGPFIEQPALSLGMKVLSSNQNGSLVGQAIGHYQIVQLLGEGGMGKVYLAEDRTLERRVALKFLAPWLVDDAWAKDQLMKEARAVARLEDSNICAVYGLEEIGGYNFIVMQYVEGETLASLLSRGPISLDRSLDLGEQVVRALSAAHSSEIIHRDIKPQNIVVTPDGRAKVLDFGLARFVQQPGAELIGTSVDEKSHFGLIVGTIAYMSPEQTAGMPLDFRTDIFSFGIVLYQMLAGENPFLRKSKEDTLVAIQSHEPPPLNDLPTEVRGELPKIVSKCLEKDRTQRFQTTEELLDALRAQRKAIERPDPALLLAQAVRRGQRRRRYLAAAAVMLVLLLAGAGYIRFKLSAVYSLALLPIVNQSSDPKVSYLSEGLTRTLLDKLSYLPRLRVKAPTVVTPRTDEPPDILKFGRDLKVEAVLSGEVIKHGETVWLHLKMLRTADGAQLWDQEFNLTDADLFSLQNDITRRVTSSLGLWLIGSDRNLLTKQQTNNPEAHRDYMQGRYYFSLKRNRETIQTAVSYFDQAIALDPNFAKAYTGRSDCYALMTSVAYGPLPTDEALNKARYNARQAIEIDSSLAEAHTSMATIKLRYDWDWRQAEIEFRRAIELDPEYPHAHYGYTSLLAVLGRFEEAIKESEVARELDPYSTLAEMNYGRALYYGRRYDEAANWLQKLLEKDPVNKQFLHLTGLVQLQQGRNQEAILTLEKLYALDKLYAAGALGYAYGKEGRRDEALRTLDELERLKSDTPVPPHEKALIYIGLGLRDEAFRLLEESYQQHFPNLFSLTTDPIYHDLSDDPRFADLARRIGLRP